MKVKLNVEGMHCKSCERIIENGVSENNGVSGIKASYADETAVVEFDPSKTNVATIINSIDNAGYAAKEIKEAGEMETKKKSGGFLSRFFTGSKK